MKFINLKEQIQQVNSPSIVSMLQSLEVNRGKAFSLPKKLKFLRLVKKIFC